MPSIALFIKQLLSEDKYSSDFSDRISERINELNAAQLQGIYNHLVATAKTSKSETWGWANRELVRKIEGVLKERVAEAEKIDKILEENRLKAVQKHRKIKEAKIEQKRVMRMIAENARKTAEAAVREEEQKRVAEEKGETMIKVYKAEERRDEWWKRTAVFFIIGVVVVSATVKDLFILLPCLVVVFLITAILVYRAQQFTVIVPRVVDESELEMEIERRGEVLQKKAISALREKERKFQEQQARDEEERKARKALKKKQAKFEAQLMIARRQQQLAQATEILTRRTTTAGTDNDSRIGNGNSRAVSADSQLDSLSDEQDHDRNSFFAQSSNSSVGSVGVHGDYQHVPLPTIIDLEGADDLDTDTMAGVEEGRAEWSSSFPEEPHTEEKDEKEEEEGYISSSEEKGKRQQQQQQSRYSRPLRMDSELMQELHDLDELYSSEDEAHRQMEIHTRKVDRLHHSAEEERDLEHGFNDSADHIADDKECIQADERVNHATDVLLALSQQRNQQHNEDAPSQRSRRNSSAKSAASASAHALPVAEPKEVELSFEDLEEGYARG